MSKKSRNQTSLEERLRIGKLVSERGNKSMKTLSVELGIPDGNLFSWQNLYKKHSGQGTSLVQSEDKDAIIIEQLATIAELQEEVMSLQEQVMVFQRITMAVGRQLK
jgi:transposase-like protein